MQAVRLLPRKWVNNVEVNVNQGMSVTAAELSGTIAQMAVKIGKQALIINNLSAENEDLKAKVAKQTEDKIKQKVGDASASKDNTDNKQNRSN